MGEKSLKNLLDSEVFCTGIAIGINLYQCIIITAYNSKEPFELNGEMYYLQDGRELLEQMLNEICK